MGLAILQSVQVYGWIFPRVKYFIQNEKPPLHSTPETKKYYTPQKNQTVLAVFETLGVLMGFVGSQSQSHLFILENPQIAYPSHRI